MPNAEGRQNTVCNVMGITLNYKASKMVNFVVIRVTILIGNEGDDPYVVNV